MPQHQQPGNDKDHDDVIPMGEGTDDAWPSSELAQEDDTAQDATLDRLADPEVASPPDAPTTPLDSGSDMTSVDADSQASAPFSSASVPAEEAAIIGPGNVIADAEAIVPPQSDQSRHDTSSAESITVPPANVHAGNPRTGEPPDQGATRVGRWRQRIGSRAADAGGTPGSTVPPAPSHPVSGASTTLQAIREFFDPGFGGIDLRWARYTAGGAAVLVIALLLANQAGAALMVASAIIPVLIVILLTAHDLYERESPALLLGLGVAGGVAGILLGSIASWVVSSQWYDGGHLNFGAGGFGGRFAPGNASFLVWFVVGLLIPAATVAGLAAAPLLMRRWPQFANEVMDGMILAGSSAAGLAIGLSSTFWWPMTYGEGPLMDVSEWTLTIAGQVLLRPLVLTLSGALIGAGVWRYMLHPGGSVTLLLPAAAGVFGVMVLALGSLALQPAGIWPEFLLTLFLAVLVFAAYRKSLAGAIEADEKAMGENGERLICPHCHLITPAGDYCGRCGKPLGVVRPETSAGAS